MATGASSTGGCARARASERARREVVGSTRHHVLCETMGARCTAVDAWTRGVDDGEEVERRLTVCRDARAWCR